MISAIILAAGESKRMGKINKLLLPLGEKTMVEHIVASFVASNADEIIVVLGHESEKIRSVLQTYPIKLIENLDYRQGMTTSIKSGIRGSSTNVSGYLICLSDLALLSPAEINYVIDRFLVNTDPTIPIIATPVFEGRRGHPIIYSTHFRDEILSHPHMNGGKQIIQDNADKILKIEMRTDHIYADIDDLNDYETLKVRFKSQNL